MPTFNVTLTGVNFHALRDAINAANPPSPPALPVILGCTGRGCPITSPKNVNVPDDTSTTPPDSVCQVQFASSSQALAWLNYYDNQSALTGISWSGANGN